jgi:hypothetical protein
LFSGKSLKHVKSGKCVHPSGGYPGDNVELVIWSGCDQQRLEFWFMKPGKNLKKGETKSY